MLPIKTYKYEFVFRAEETLYFPPYPGSMFRGAFGWTFRETVCITGYKECTRCPVAGNCSYFRIFETENKNHEVWYLKNVQKLPHPLVILPPLSQKKVEQGQEFSLVLTIIGGAIDYLPFLVYTFSKMGKRGLGKDRKKVIFTRIYRVESEEIKTVVYTEADTTLDNHHKEYPAKPFNTEAEKITLEFITPLRIQSEGRVLTRSKDLTIRLLLRTMQKRVYSLIKLFCTPEFEGVLDEDLYSALEISNNNLKFFSWERFSARQNKKMDLGGFVGSIELTGNFKEFGELLQVAETVHVGKNTLFGLGKFTLIP